MSKLPYIFTAVNGVYEKYFYFLWDVFITLLF